MSKGHARTNIMNGNNVIGLILSSVTFPESFSEEDRQKFAGEVASAAGRFMPDTDSVEEMVSDVTFSARQLTVKFGSHKTKASKGEKISYTFRISTWLVAVSAAKVEKVTGYSFPIDLSKSDFWQTWERAEVKSEVKPEEAPAS